MPNQICFNIIEKAILTNLVKIMNGSEDEIGTIFFQRECFLSRIVAQLALLISEENCTNISLLVYTFDHFLWFDCEFVDSSIILQNGAE